MRRLITLPLVLLSSALAAHEHHGHAQWSEHNGQRCVTSNGMPNHATGQFPNRGNPHRISEQATHLCVTLTPKKNPTPTMIDRGAIGVAINGVPFRPETADYYDASSQRSFSRNPQSGWNLEGLGARDLLGMDSNNAHVDERGLYHYHGVPPTLKAHSSLLGYAADGFEIHYRANQPPSGYQLKPGQRPTAPYGRYDGIYIEDWQYVGGPHTLDRCNGGELDGRFVYFATDSFPFFPRCLWGTPSVDFSPRARPNAAQPSQRLPARTNDATARRQPPAAAIDACSGRSDGQRCQFSPPGRPSLQGQCRRTPQGVTACVP